MPTKFLNGKTALVVGASKGIGRAVSLAFSQAGARVFTVARSSPAHAALSAELKMVNKENAAIELDLRDESSLHALCAQCAKSDIDIVFHNIGGTLDVKGAYFAAEALRRVMYFNLEVAVEINRQLLPKMQQKGWGRSIHVSSNASLAASTNFAYGIAKAALNTYCEKMGSELGGSGVAVTNLILGPVQYPGNLWDTRLKDHPDETAQFMAQSSILGRPTRPEEVAEIALFLCLPEAELFSATSLRLDGARK